MLVPIENKCLQCKRIFCCPKCRMKHERVAHAGPAVVEPPAEAEAACALCAGKRFTLQKQHSTEMIDHLVQHHLPLRCNKCAKVFACVADFLAITACKLLTKESCELRFEQTVAPPPTDKYGRLLTAMSVSQEGSPEGNDDQQDKENHISHANDSPLTPITQWNMRWKSKIGGGLLTDSISSIRNLSSMTNNSTSNIQLSHIQLSHIQPHSPRNKKSLVRQTSTPMYRGMGTDCGKVMVRNRPNSFESINSSEQISSISPNISTASDCSPTNPTNRATPPRQKVSRLRNKLPVSATPLRQVMSRSIHKAMVQHGMHMKYMPSRMHYSPVSPRSPAATPLDLRTSPVMRRTVSMHFSDSDIDPNYNKSSIPTNIERQKSDSNISSDSSKPFNDNSNPPNTAIDSVYESCKSLDTNTLDEKSVQDVQPVVAPQYTEQTPKTTGVLFKVNSFADRQAALQPSIANKSEEAQLDVVDDEEGATAIVPEYETSDDGENTDNWFTPCARVRRAATWSNNLQPSQLSYSSPQEPKEHYEEEAESMWVTDNELSDQDSVFYASEKVISPTGDKIAAPKSGGGLWSIVTSVIRLASFRPEPPKTVADGGATLLKRSATYSGRHSPLDQKVGSDADSRTNKRRRTKTSGSYHADGILQTRKISGRPPLKRMRRVPS